MALKCAFLLLLLLSIVHIIFGLPSTRSSMILVDSDNDDTLRSLFPRYRSWGQRRRTENNLKQEQSSEVITGQNPYMVLVVKKAENDKESGEKQENEKSGEEEEEEKEEPAGGGFGSFAQHHSSSIDRLIGTHLDSEEGEGRFSDPDDETEDENKWYPVATVQYPL